jgi:hypothetical protein
MSIHRPKRASSRRADSASGIRTPSNAPSAKPPKWKDVVADQPEQAFAAYNSAATFARDALILHPKFGKGVVVEVDGNKVHILFEEGIRKLVHGLPA